MGTYTWDALPVIGSGPTLETDIRATLEQWRANCADLDDDVSGISGVLSGSTGSTDNAILRADGTGGTTIQESLVTIDDSGAINIPSGQTYKINGTAHTHTADSILPSQTGNSGKYLTTNGTTASWGSISGYATTADVIALAIALGG